MSILGRIFTMISEVLAKIERAPSENLPPRDLPTPFQGRFTLTDKFISDARAEGRD